MTKIARIMMFLAIGVAATSFVAALRYAANNPESEHPPLVPSCVFVGAMALAGVAKYVKERQ